MVKIIDNEWFITYIFPLGPTPPLGIRNNVNEPRAKKYKVLNIIVKEPDPG